MKNPKPYIYLSGIFYYAINDELTGLWGLQSIQDPADIDIDEHHIPVDIRHCACEVVQGSNDDIYYDVKRACRFFDEYYLNLEQRSPNLFNVWCDQIEREERRLEKLNEAILLDHIKDYSHGNILFHDFSYLLENDLGWSIVKITPFSPVELELHLAKFGKDPEEMMGEPVAIETRTIYVKLEA